MSPLESGRGRRSTAAWWLAAAIAVAYLVTMVATGALPRHRQLVAFEARGVMTVGPETIVRVELDHQGRRLGFVRRADGGWAQTSASASASAPAARSGDLPASTATSVEPAGPAEPASRMEPLAEPMAAKLSMAVQFMHTAAPIRRLGAADISSRALHEFGIDDGSLRVRLWDRSGETPRLGVRFGAWNPEDTAQYMTVDGGTGLILMSRFVGAEWAAVATALLPP